MDTVSDFCDHDIKPIVTENYDGGELRLGTSDTILSPKNFPHLADLKGRTLITSDGTTVLGADDKAGIAEIMTMIERIPNFRFLPPAPVSLLPALLFLWQVLLSLLSLLQNQILFPEHIPDLALQPF